jgi:glycosyltransferase involved in cell wall biosynthesis
MDGERIDPHESAPRIAYVTTVALSVRLLFTNQLHHLRRAGFDVTAVSGGGGDLEAVHAAGIRHILVPFTRRVNPLRDIAATWRLWRVFRRERFTIVHTHQPKPGLFGRLAARLAGVPIVINTVHGFMFTERSSPLKRRLWIWLERLGGRCSDRLLCVSREDVETAVCERISAADAVVHIGGGIDIERFSRDAVASRGLADVRAQIGIAPRQRVIGFVGRLVREKGLPELLDAFEEVQRSVPEAVLLLVGPDDPDKTDAMTPAAVAQSHPGLAVRFAGYRHDMPDVYALMDIFVLPSHREGLPQTLMEASAMGIPSVTTDVRGCREIVVDGETGLIVPPGDPSALAAALVRLLRDSALAQRLGASASARARAQYDERAVFSRLQDVYLELLRSETSRRSIWARTGSAS